MQQLSASARRDYWGFPTSAWQLVILQQFAFVLPGQYLQKIVRQIPRWLALDRNMYLIALLTLISVNRVWYSGYRYTIVGSSSWCLRYVWGTTSADSGWPDNLISKNKLLVYTSIGRYSIKKTLAECQQPRDGVSISSWLAWMKLHVMKHVYAQSCPLIIFPHHPINLQYYARSTEQPIIFWLRFHKLHLEFPMQKMITPFNAYD